MPGTDATPEEIGEFWDTHSLADYDAQMHDVHFDVDIQQRTFLVPVEGKLAKKITAIAKRDGLVLETLVNLWLQEKLMEAQQA